VAMLQLNGTSLYYEDTGGSGQAIVFSHGLLWNSALFAPQIAALKGQYRCLAYDHRGQGKSADGVGHAINMDTLTADAATLIETLKVAPVHFCGLSMGGGVAMQLAINRPDLIRSLVLLETSADPEPSQSKLKYQMLNLIARFFGTGLVINAVMPIMFGKTALNDGTRAHERSTWRQQLSSNRRSIWRAVNGVIEREGLHHKLEKITAPTLVIVGDEDVATPREKAERIAGAIGGSKLVVIPHAGHSSTLEQPDAVTTAIAEFLKAT
jgi:3-oxoadipate enol-lactonase